jgi:fibronectin type 3 domain-containing protein
MLLCAAGLLAIPRKAFSQGQRMNRPIGVICLRSLVGSLLAIVAAILLYGSNHADAQAPPGIGIMYLTNSDAVGDPIHDWTDDPSLTNPFVQGVAIRTQWGRVEPHEHANADDFYWDFLDQGVALCAAHGKKVSILVTAGVTTPQWVYDAGAPVFNVTEQYGYSSITDGVTTAGSTRVRSAGNTAGWNSSYSIGLQISGGSIPAGATIVAVNSSSSVTISAPATQSATGLAIVTAQISPMPLPWDPVFQAKWGAFIQALAARYGNAPNLAYVVMGGPGRRAESYFCFTDYDMDYFINTLGGLPNWQQGVQWIIDQYGTYFPNTPFILDMASPIPTTDGTASLQAVCDYGVARYSGNHFGVKSDGLLYPSGPPNGSIGATEVSLLCPTSTVGYQFWLFQGEAIDPPTGRFMLDLGLARGIAFGAHFIEVYSGDCDDPILAPLLTSAAAVLTTTPPIPTTPSGLTARATSSSSIDLGWTDNANNEIGERIERSVGSNNSYALLENVGPNVTAVTDDRLVDGTQYYYRVLAFNAGGSSTYSNKQSAITTLNSPTSLIATAVSSSQINLTWTDNSSSEGGFKIDRSPVDNLHYTQIATVSSNVTTYNDTGLNEGTKYYYRVRAYNTIATSEYPDESHATTFSNIPVAPSGLIITSVTSNKVFLAWTDNSGNESGFKIQRKKGATGTYAQIATPGWNVTTYTDDDNALLDGTQYYYKVCAYSSAGDSPFSNEVNGTTALAKPTSATATAVSSSQVNLTWIDNSVSETGYKIERKRTANGTYSQIAQVGTNMQSYSNTTGLQSGTRYYYRVRATNGTLNSDYSNEPFAVTFR